MKLSVILGVAHMTLGVFLKGLNSAFFHRWVELAFEVLPQLLLLLGIFGLMDTLIVAKWLTDYSGRESQAPSIVSSMINMFLNLGRKSSPEDVQLVPNQTGVMQAVLVVSAVSIPLMLFVKPIYLYRKGKRDEVVEVKEELPSEIDRIRAQEIVKTERRKKHNEDFGDLFIHQLIETIEFVLGTVSNTASYLRLWALSLAHSQLSKVFFDGTISLGLKQNSFILVFLGFFVFIAFTLGVLMLMDAMEAFLHTLRLHWVEFQNKFYKGGGAKWQPYSFDQLFKQ
jgi:V-type H+-transporting ATPase subunit a